MDTETKVYDSGDQIVNVEIPDQISLRDWFAGMAMLGVISGKAHEYWSGYISDADVAQNAYATADAMLARGAKK